MKVTLYTSCLILLISAFNAQNATAEEPDLHTWKSIQYPDVPCRWATGITTPSLHPSDEGLRLSLLFYSGSPKFYSGLQKQFVWPAHEKMTARLHVGGRIIEHNKPDQFIGNGLIWDGNSLGSTTSIDRVFPWGDNKFEEAWIELRFPDHVFWLEVPYGFTRDPSQKLCPATQDGRPEIAPAMKDLEQGAKIVPWGHVEYEFGEIQNDWQLTLLQSNPYEPNCELVLYRDDAEIGKSSYLWNLFTPRTGVTVKNSSGTVLVGHLMSLRRHRDGRRRSDEFEFNYSPLNKDVRGWYKAVVKVDDKSYEKTIPSSLLSDHHGRAEYESQDTLRSKSDR